MKKILFCVISLCILLTGCRGTGSDISNDSVDNYEKDWNYISANDGTGFYYIGTDSGYELYRRDEGSNEESLILRNDDIRCLTLTGPWIYFVGSDNNICRVKTNGDDFSVVMNYESLKSYEDECVVSLNAIDDTLFIQMSFELYRYDISDDVTEQITHDARWLALNGDFLYYCGKEGIIYKIGTKDDKPLAVSELQTDGSGKEDERSVYKYFDFIDDTMYYYKRRPDGLFRLKDGKSTLIDGDTNIDEFTLCAYDKKLYYITRDGEDGILKMYDPQDGSISEISAVKNSTGGSSVKIRNGYLYYFDKQGSLQRIKL